MQMCDVDAKPIRIATFDITTCLKIDGRTFPAIQTAPGLFDGPIEFAPHLS